MMGVHNPWSEGWRYAAAWSVLYVGGVPGMVMPYLEVLRSAG